MSISPVMPEWIKVESPITETSFLLNSAPLAFAIPCAAETDAPIQIVVSTLESGLTETNEKVEEKVESFDDEAFILKNFRLIPSYDIKHNGRFFSCCRVKWLIKSALFSASWVDSSSKSDLPPDFHNDKHHIMMDIMRIDDGAGGKHSPNSFERTNKYLKNSLGPNYKTKLKGCSLYFDPDTRNDKEYNFKAYFKNLF